MARVQLTLYNDPGEAECFVNILCSDGSYQRLAVTINTGAELSLFDASLLDLISCRETRRISVNQAGIAQQVFDATEGYIRIFIEDAQGARTRVFEILVMFAKTEANLLGFKDVLDVATLFIDMRQTKTGWIELDD